VVRVCANVNYAWIWVIKLSKLFSTSFLVTVMCAVVTNGPRNIVCLKVDYPCELYRWGLCVWCKSDVNVECQLGSYQ
jgi:hypothetical protein